MKIIIRAPSFEEEERRVKKLLEKKMFYEEHGYSAFFPQGDLREVFHREEYEKGVQIVTGEKEIIEQAIDRLKYLASHTDIFLPEALTIVLTKYGVGGSFDVASGRIVVMMRPDGSLIKPPSHLVVHELLHIATDESYAKRYGLTHAQNERFIDLLCRDVFGDILKDYRMQPMGDVSSDDTLNVWVQSWLRRP